jgi:Protein of unknown function (DUF3034)
MGHGFSLNLAGNRLASAAIGIGQARATFERSMPLSTFPPRRLSRFDMSIRPIPRFPLFSPGAQRLLRGAAAALGLCAAIGPAAAGDRLLGTWGVTQAEGGGGGGLTPWALITGSGSRDQIGATAYATHWRSQGGFELQATGAAVGFYDTVELSLARWRFGLSDTVPGESIDMDIVGAKWRVFGDAVYEQDHWLPQVAVGAQYKNNHDMAVPSALGARRGSDTDFYVSATKVWLGALAGRNALANATLRSTRANQFGLLGFGGDQGDSSSLEPEASLGLLVRDDLAIGAEWRSKPDRLSVFREERAVDAFVAWFPNRYVSFTLAWLDLGNIANKPGQKGWYLSLQGAL